MLATIDQRTHTAGRRIAISPRFDDFQAAAAHGYYRLAEAIIIKAVQDAAGLGNVSERVRATAAGWLTSEAGVMFCEVTGFDHQVITAWVRNGCPAAPVLAVDNRKRKGVA